MLANLQLVLDNPEVNYRQTSNLQGVLMEQIDTEYAERLHQNTLNPYSMSVIREGNKTIWNISTLNQEAYEQIIMPLLSDSFQSFEMKKKELSIKILEKDLTTKPKNELMQDFYKGEVSKYINIEFVTPTAFKSEGHYIFYPDVRLMYNSLMNKYSAASTEVDMRDESTLEELMKHSEIVHYKLRSVPFPLEGIRVPGFVGTITIKIHGNQTLASYAKLLFSFGEFSGVGIKTAMGMGRIRLYEKGSDKNVHKDE